MATKPTYEELRKRVEELEKPQTLSFRVGDKGGVSVYGLGRFPVTLYYEQWMALLAAVDKLRAFIEAHKKELKLKES